MKCLTIGVSHVHELGFSSPLEIYDVLTKQGRTRESRKMQLAYSDELFYYFVPYSVALKVFENNATDINVDEKYILDLPFGNGICNDRSYIRNLLTSSAIHTVNYGKYRILDIIRSVLDSAAPYVTIDYSFCSLEGRMESIMLSEANRQGKTISNTNFNT